MNKIFSKYFCFFLVIINFTYVFSYLSKISQSSQEQIISNLKFIRNLKISEFNDKISEKPKVSIVIPVYNGEDYVYELIACIQHQTLKDLEMIFVDDNSPDESYEKITEAQLIDQRIKILRNKKNRGIFYSRFYGALQSKGSYVAFIDCDDLYINPMLLSEAYLSAESKNLDLVQYEYIKSDYDRGEKYENFLAVVSDFTYFELKTPPDIKTLFVGQKNNPKGSIAVFDKLYKKSLINKMADFFGEAIINKHIFFMEDFLMNFSAFREAESFMLIKNFGIWVWNNNQNSPLKKGYEEKSVNAVSSKSEMKKLEDYLTVLEIVFQLTENDPSEETFRYNILNRLSSPNDLRNLFSMSYHYEKLLNICRKFYNWKYITKEIKKKVKIFCKETVEMSHDNKLKYMKIFEKK